ncbi:hypothetical protein [endosymbiont GvMRE of Glomus versiforme]|uniref:hypothetical protein n=1 Tax=endosymbiont GvMRE of Glomus versiforme TaxID=2039283 RepID=UPI0011C49E95|nr:hypothetical protein [endosymbiont GvMRE of Glomus versiforme]
MRPHEQNKNYLDQAHRALANPYIPPQTGPDHNDAIQRVKDEMQKSPSVSDSELNTELGKNNWITWLRETQTQTELNARESQAINAVKEARRKKENPLPPPQENDLDRLRREAIEAVNQHWKDKANSDSKVNNKDQNTVLGSNWESGISGKSTPGEITAEKDRLIKLIDDEKAKEGSGPIPGGPSYPDNGDSGSEDSSNSSGGKTPPGDKDSGKPGDQGGGTDEGSGDGSSGSQEEQIIQEEGWQNITSETVGTIISELDSINTQGGKDKDDGLDKVKEILKKVNQAKGKKEFNELAKTLQEELEQLQKNSQLVAQMQSLKKEVNEAIQHLENLKNKKPQDQEQSQENWWKKQSTGVKAAIIFGILAGIILIGVIISQLTKKSKEPEE